MNLKGSKTEQNLWEAFAGEAKARTKYTFYESVAKKEGYVQIANFFKETSDNEKEHAELWAKRLGGIGTTEENLKAGVEGERYEHTEMYPEFARVAREEGFEDIAKQFERVAKIEKEHEERYQKLVDNLQKGLVFHRDMEQEWQCLNCGHIHVGKDAPLICATCNHAQAYFAIRGMNY